MNHISLQSSFDRGSTFTSALRLSRRPFSSNIGFGAKEGLPDLGSRLGLLSEERQAIGLWTDTPLGTPSTQKQDLASVRVAFSKRRRFSEAVENALRYGGIAFLLIGLTLAALWLRSRGAAHTEDPAPR